MDRRRRTIFLTLLLLLGGVGVWFLGPAQWQGALDRAERPRGTPKDPPTEDEGGAPSLVGRRSDPVETPRGDPATGLEVRFVVAGTTVRVPLAAWQVEAGGGTPFTGTADYDGRTMIPAEVVAAWRRHGFVAHRLPLLEEVVLDEPPPAKDGVATIALGFVENAGEVAIQRYEGHVLDRTYHGIAGAWLRFTEGPLEWWAQADGRGRFDVSLPVADGQARLLLVACAPGYSDAGRLLPLDGASAVQVVLSENRKRATMRVRVLMPDGTPAEGARVRVPSRPVTGGIIGGSSPVLRRRFPGRGLTDADGYFVTHGILLGQTPVRAHLGDLVADELRDLTWPETEVVLTLGPGRTIRGRVRAPCREDCPRGTHETTLIIVGSPRLRAEIAPGRDRAAPFELRGAPLCRVSLSIRSACHRYKTVVVPPSESPEPVDLGEIVLTAHPR